MCFYHIRQILFRRANGSCYIITTIETVDDNIRRGIFTIDIHEGSTTHIRHTGATKYSVQVAFSYRDRGITTRVSCITAAIDMSGNDNLSIDIED